MRNIVDNIGVHASHCCHSHGCKYGDEDCPVELGYVPQDYECEDCCYEREEIEAVLADKNQLTNYLEKLTKYSKNSKVTLVLKNAIKELKELEKAENE